MKKQSLQLLLCKYDVPFATGKSVQDIYQLSTSHAAMDLPVCKITAEGGKVNHKVDQAWLPSVREQPSIIRIPFMTSR